MNNNLIKKNIILSVSAQSISLMISVISGFAIPRFIDEYQYAYREVFMLYLSYAGIVHFGLVDGLLLRYSQYNYNQIDKPKLLSQLKLMICFMTIGAFIAIGVSNATLTSVYQRVVILVSMSMITKNIVTYNSYIYQMTNQINKYALLIFCQRVAYGVIIIILLLFKVNVFEWYCLADTFGDIFAISLAIGFDKDFFFQKSISLNIAIKEWYTNVSVGAVLLLSNLTSSFIIGVAKMIVQWRWDELIFGKLAFSFSLSSIFITFISAISVVLFPTFKRMESSQLSELYIKMRQGISPLFFIMLMGYFPLCEIVEILVPKYVTSLTYLGIFLPIIVYTSKANLLTNNYLKTYRKERAMLFINSISVVIATDMYLISAYLFNNIFAILISMVLVTMLNSVASEMVITRMFNTSIVKEYIVEGILSLSFVIVTNRFDRWIACTIYLGLLIVYLIIEKEHIYPLIEKISKRQRK